MYRKWIGLALAAALISAGGLASRFSSAQAQDPKHKETETPLGKFMGVAAVALAAVNVFGGFLVTRRMLEMFKKKEKKESK